MARLKSGLFSFWPFAVLFLIFLGPLLLLQKSFILSDYSVQHVPWAIHTFQALRHGELPFWTHSMALGFPLFAEGQCAALYFWNVLAYRMLPFLAAYTWSIPFHMLMGGIGMYAYARSLKRSVNASVVAAVCFCFASSYSGCFANTASLRTLCWFPWVLMMLEKIRNGGYERIGLRSLMLIFFISQQWLAGFPQMAVYAFFYYVVHESLAFRSADARYRVLACRVLALAFLLGTLLAWPQIAATLELVSVSARQNESVSFALWGSVPPPALVSLFFPQWGNAMRVSFYLGILPLIFLSGLFFVKREKNVTRHALLALLFTLLALGKNNPVYVWVIEALSLTSLRIPAKFLFFVVSSLSVLAAYGYDLLADRGLSEKATQRLTRLWIVVTSFMALAPLWALGIYQAIQAQWPNIRNFAVARVLAEKGVLAKPADYYAGILERAFLGLADLFTYANVYNLQTIALAIVSVFVVMRYLRNKLSVDRFFVLCGLILVWDLTVFGFGLGTGFIGNAGAWSNTSPNVSMQRVIDRVKKDPGLLAEFVRDGEKELFYPNKAMTYGIRHIGGYSPLLIKKYYELTHDLGVSDSSLGRSTFDEQVWLSQRGLIDLMGVRYLHTDRPIQWASVRSLESDGSFYFFENEAALMPVIGYGRWKVIEDKTERLAYLKSPVFDPHKEIILEESPGFSASPDDVARAIAPGELEAGSSATHLNIHLHMPYDGIVFVRCTAYPGWRTILDNTEVPWFIVDHAFVGVAVPRGIHVLTVQYQPTRWTLNLLASLAGVLGCVAFAIFIHFLEKRGYNNSP